ncbi:MAG: hypothetical protein WD118_11685 [Phycisphaeraceae bacterium]
MAVHHRPDPETDPFRPPVIPTEVFCLHCHREYESYLIEWRERVADGKREGFWCCPMPDCDGRGFGFDIFPTDPDYRDEFGEPMGLFSDDDDDDDDGQDFDDGWTPGDDAEAIDDIWLEQMTDIDALDQIIALPESDTPGTPGSPETAGSPDASGNGTAAPDAPANDAGTRFTRPPVDHPPANDEFLPIALDDESLYPDGKRRWDDDIPW